MSAKGIDRIAAGGIAVVAVLILLAIFNAVLEQRAPPASIEKTHLPSLCAQYLDDDSEAWNDCMGVGKK